MLLAEPEILLGRQCFPDAQTAMLGAKSPLGYFSASWYGSDVSDERGAFCVVSDPGPLSRYVGDFLNVAVGKRDVYVYCIGSATNLISDIALTRRAYLAIALLATDPIAAKVSVIR